MIDDSNESNTGWARFSDDRKLRFRLARLLPGTGGVIDHVGLSLESLRHLKLRRVVFVMLNSSIADAFKLDPTVKKCVAFATAWGAHVVEVVNIFALCSTDPDGLYEWTLGMSPQQWADINGENCTQILAACRGAELVVAAWGKHGAHLAQGALVRTLLRADGIKLHYLDLNKDGSPKHPLYIKGGTLPKEWHL